jgi:hypothetical protein
LLSPPRLCPSHLDPVVGEQVGARLVDPISQSPAAVRGRYLPALDGVRALAIVSVLAYHLGFGWAQGGYLGVDLFFVLSGFLITGLLLEEHRGTGRVLIGRFWARRARRLLPGLLLMIAALSIWVAFNRGDTDLSQVMRSLPSSTSPTGTCCWLTSRTSRSSPRRRRCSTRGHLQ